jgi:hypothetical protein
MLFHPCCGKKSGSSHFLQAFGACEREDLILFDCPGDHRSSHSSRALRANIEAALGAFNHDIIAPRLSAGFQRRHFDFFTFAERNSERIFRSSDWFETNELGADPAQRGKCKHGAVALLLSITMLSNDDRMLSVLKA